MLLSEYYIPDPTRKLVDTLSDPRLDFEKHRDEVNKLTLSLSIRFLADYLEIEATDIDEIRNEVGMSLGTLQLQMRIYSEEMNKYLRDKNYKPDDGFYRTDCFGLMAAADIKGTAAVMKEIVFNESLKSREGLFLTLDNGLGTGILLLGSYIAGKRKGFKNICCIGVDTQKHAVSKSHQALSGCISKDCFNVFQKDAQDPFLKSYYSKDLSYWISETICQNTPLMFVIDNTLKISNHKSLFSLPRHNLGDTFPFILDTAFKNMPDFETSVKTGQIGMFPDLINGHYIPDGKEGSLRLLTGITPTEFMPLNDVGKEFTKYEDLGFLYKRWE